MTVVFVAVTFGISLFGYVRLSAFIFNRFLLSVVAIGILLVTERLAEQCADQLAPRKMEGRTPLVVEIPDRHGSRAQDSITRYIREAIGVKL